MICILGIIPARGGSKGIPNKNIVALGKKPLIAHTIAAVQGSTLLSDCILSTDSEAIAYTAGQYGLQTSSLRPPELSTDSAKTIDVVLFELEHYERTNKVTVDAVVLLQPTTPFRTSIDIDNALIHFFDKKADSLISVYEATSVHPSIMYYYETERLHSVIPEGRYSARRQEFKPVYVRNGALYIATREQLVKNRSFFCDNMAAYIMPRERSVNIDEPFDLELAEWMMSRHGQE